MSAAVVVLIGAAFLPRLMPHAPGGEAPSVRLLGAGSSGPPPPAPAGQTKDKKPETFGVGGEVAGLYPGSEVDLVLTVTNPWNFAIRVTKLTATATGTDRAGCHHSVVVPGSFMGSLVVPAEGSAVQEIPIRMDPAAPDECKSAAFSLDYAGVAERAR